MAPDGGVDTITADLRTVSLEDKYTSQQGYAYLSGVQALVRLPIVQRRRDMRLGLNTGGFISGYRGSPLSGYDQALWRAGDHLKAHNIAFQPGVNEDLAATAVWGSQQAALYPGATVDGVFGIWYGKGPGVDRSGDVFKHANFAGTARHGGVLALAGDDHAAKSSTVPHQSEHAFSAAMMPVLNPANVQEIVDLGLHGFALSRFSGLWVGFKLTAETCDSSASILVDEDAAAPLLPSFDFPFDGVNIRPEKHQPLIQEDRLMQHKLYAALAYARENRLDRQTLGSPDRRIGIVTTGKSSLDVLQALELLGLSPQDAEAKGIAVFKVAMPWPLEPEAVRAFSEGLDEIIVVEEKRALIENQMKEQLYNWTAPKRPVIVGKFDEAREWILPSTGELTPAQIAIALGKRFVRRPGFDGLEKRVAFLEQKRAEKSGPEAPLSRMAYFCSGCPHNTSTKVPEGSRALAGIGCHYMAVWMPQTRTESFTQMGGEGVSWIGQAPFTTQEHVFVNLGDGTYYHSGLLAIRQSIAAKVNITYKILFNDAVAMTGGQPVDGSLNPEQICTELAAEGVARIVVASDQPEKYAGTILPAGTTVEHRDRLDAVQRELRETSGTTILLYDQTCAAEKRRRRKRGLMPDPDRRIFVNELVCEGCGDCGKASNCLSVTPVETEFGTKRQIDQSSCNKDFSCVNGFCPSFVSVSGAVPAKPSPVAADGGDPLPPPPLPTLDKPFNILVTGVGGTGVVTIGALLGMAGHLEGKGVTVLDQIGLAQKGGAVLSHLRFAAKPEDIHAVRVAPGEADALIGCDLVVAAGNESLSRTKSGRTRAVVNRHEAVTGHFTQDPNYVFPGGALVDRLLKALGEENVSVVEGTSLATRLMGDSIATNLFMLGLAFQKGLVPVSAAAIEEAVRLNGVAVTANIQAFTWGRRAALRPEAVSMHAAPEVQHDHRNRSETLDDMIGRRTADLTAYQDSAYAARYRNIVDAVAEAEARVSGPIETPVALEARPLTAAVATYAYKVMAIKDEYEVARLYSDGRFLRQLKSSFEGTPKLSFHLAPPLLSPNDTETGKPRKVTFGPWMLKAFGVLAHLKGLRGSALDPFGRTAERKAERRLREDYLNLMQKVAEGLTTETFGTAVDMAELPDQVRGFGPVKEANLMEVRERWAALEADWDRPIPAVAAE